MECVLLAAFAHISDNFKTATKGAGLMGIPEPKAVYPEERFQSAILALIRDALNTSGLKYVLLEGFGVDIAAFIEDICLIGGDRCPLIPALYTV